MNGASSAEGCSHLRASLWIFAAVCRCESDLACRHVNWCKEHTQIRSPAVKAVLPVQGEHGNGEKPFSGAGTGGPVGQSLQFPPGFHPGATPPHGAYQHPPGHPRAQNPPVRVGQMLHPGAGPLGLYGGAGLMGRPGELEYPWQPQAGPPRQGFHVGPVESMNYMGGMRYDDAMPHAAEAGVRGSSTGSAKQRNSSLNASTGTITNITKMSWTDFHKYASFSFFLGVQVSHRCCKATTSPELLQHADMSGAIRCAHMCDQSANQGLDVYVGTCNDIPCRQPRQYSTMLLYKW